MRTTPTSRADNSENPRRSGGEENWNQNRGQNLDDENFNDDGAIQTRNRWGQNLNETMNDEIDDEDLPPRRSYKDDEDDSQQQPSTFSRNNYR